jgi:hypothetical protein
MRLREVLHVPDATHDILSTTKWVQDNNNSRAQFVQTAAHSHLDLDQGRVALNKYRSQLYLTGTVQHTVTTLPIDVASDDDSIQLMLKAPYGLPASGADFTLAAIGAVPTEEPCFYQWLDPATDVTVYAAKFVDDLTFAANPSQRHLEELQRLLRHLKATTDPTIRFTADNIYINTAANGPVGRISRKQGSVATSNCPAELTAMFLACERLACTQLARAFDTPLPTTGMPMHVDCVPAFDAAPHRDPKASRIINTYE